MTLISTFEIFLFFTHACHAIIHYTVDQYSNPSVIPILQSSFVIAAEIYKFSTALVVQVEQSARCVCVSGQ